MYSYRVKRGRPNLRLMSQQPQPDHRVDGAEAPDGEHSVLFYDTDDSYLETLNRFVRAGVDENETCVVIATRARLSQLGARLRADGLDLAALRRGGRYTTIDAAKTLDTLIVDGVLDVDRVKRAASDIVERAMASGRPVRIVGEMVALAWQSGNQSASIQLEALWHELHQHASPPFTLFCAYPLELLTHDEQSAGLAAICASHARVLQTGDAPAPDADGQTQRPLLQLQLQAHALKVEIAQWRLAGERLRISEQQYRGLFEASLDGIVIIDAHSGLVSAANPAAEKLLGLAPGQLLGRALWELGVFPDRDSASEVLRGLGERPVLRYEALPLQMDGDQRRFIELTASRIQTDMGAIIQCVLRDVTDSQQLAHKAAERAQELEALQTVTDVALAHLSVDTLLRELLERTRSVLHVDNVAILLPDATGRDLTIHMARGPEEEVAGQVRVPIGRGAAGRIAATREPLIIDDLRTASVVNPFLHQRLRSFMGVPLLIDDRLTGVIHAATALPHTFTAREVRLLQLVAERIAVAIERAQLHQATQEARQNAMKRAQQLHATIEAIADGVVTFDHTGSLVQMNVTAQRMMGFDAPPPYSTAEVTFGHRNVRDSSGNPLAVEDWPVSRVLRGEIITGAQAMDVIVEAAGGQDRQFSVSGAPIYDATGGVAGAVCVFRDVTAQRRLQQRTHEALGALLAMASTLVDLSADVPEGAQSPTHSDPRLTSPISPAASQVAHRLADLICNVLDCQRVSIVAIDAESHRPIPIALAGLEPAVERQWWTMHRERAENLGEEIDSGLLSLFMAGETVEIDMTRPPYDTRPNPFGVTTMLVAPMRIGADLLGIIALDFNGAPHAFTEQERALADAVAQLAALVFERERLLREREEARGRELAAQETSRRMNTFLGIAGHELRTPVTSIKMGVQVSEHALRGILDADLPPETTRRLQRAQALLARANDQANRLTRLIEDVLHVTRSQAGELNLHAEMSDLVDTVRQAIEGQRLSWPERRIDLIAPASGLSFIFARDRIEQVVANLVSNALKYSSEEQPVEVRVTRRGQMAHISVQDHGPGLTREMQAQVWEPFHQVDGIQQQAGSGVGLGLGLYICRTLIERHGGRYGIESVVGEGSIFWFELPMEPSLTIEPDRGAVE